MTRSGGRHRIEDHHASWWAPLLIRDDHADHVHVAPPWQLSMGSLVLDGPTRIAFRDGIDGITRVIEVPDDPGIPFDPTRRAFERLDELRSYVDGLVAETEEPLVTDVPRYADSSIFGSVALDDDPASAGLDGLADDSADLDGDFASAGLDLDVAAAGLDGDSESRTDRFWSPAAPATSGYVTTGWQIPAGPPFTYSFPSVVEQMEAATAPIPTVHPRVAGEDFPQVSEVHSDANDLQITVRRWLIGDGPLDLRGSADDDLGKCD